MSSRQEIFDNLTNVTFGHTKTVHGLCNALGVSSSHTHRVKNAALPGRMPNKKPKAVIPLVNNIKIDVFNL